MEICRAAYRWTSEEAGIAVRRHSESQIRPGVAWGVAIALGVLGVLAAGLLSQQVVEDPQAYVCCASPLLIWLAILQNLRDAANKARAQFKKDPGADQLVEWEISAQEIKHWQRGLYYTAAAWKNFVKITEAPDGFLFYTHTSVLLWLPFRAFETPEAVAKTREFVQGSGVPYQKIAR